MVTHAVTLVPGDGVGPELVSAARAVLEATGVAFAWEVHEAGASVGRDGPLPAATLASIRRTGVCLRGPLETPVGAPNVNVALRASLGLFGGVRPCRSIPGVPSRYEGVDVVVIRENTEDTYTGLEFEMGDPRTVELVEAIAGATGTRIRRDAGISVKAISVTASERIARFAFGYAAEHGRARVTAGHKANIMKRSDGLFLEACRRVAAEHPSIGFEERIVDALAMALVQRPSELDVLVLPNLYGDLVSELCAGLVGGPWVVPAADLGQDVAVFGSLHGSAPPPGRGADATATMLAGAMLLRHVGEAPAAERLEAAVRRVAGGGGGRGDARRMADAVVAAIGG